jgi:hypothetical protein
VGNFNSKDKMTSEGRRLPHVPLVTLHMWATVAREIPNQQGSRFLCFHFLNSPAEYLCMED